MKKSAFTLAEILICIIIIGFFATIMLSTVKTKELDEKTKLAALYKAIEVINEASANILSTETTSVPMGEFLINAAGTYEFAVYNNKNETASNSDVFDLYKKYIKFENTTGFCSFSGYCTGTNASLSSMPGGKISGEIAIGILLNNKAKPGSCPSVYQPGSKTLSTVKGQCWGKLYIDLNGKKTPNAHGQDVFIYGLNATGVAH